MKQYEVKWYLEKAYGDPEGTLMVTAENREQAATSAMIEVRAMYPNLSVEKNIRFTSVKAMT